MSAETSTIALAQRPDLVVQRQRCRRQDVWVVKDPIALAYHQLGPEEYFILRLLDGTRSSEAIRDAFEQQFAPRQISHREIQALLASMHRKGLLLADAQGQADMLLERNRDARWRAVRGNLTNVLAIRFPGIAPDRYLTAAYPCVRWLFSPWTIAVCVSLILVTLFYAGVHWDTLYLRLPQISEFFTPGNIALLAVSLAMVKVLHELGHAFTCKHFGGECHEIGMMLLVFTPCLYCDTSDTWMLRSKWRRIAVTAAGMYVELVLGALSFWLWLASEPGVLNSLFLNVVIICTVSTLLTNGNPLLRFDGYYLLADWLEIPNLAQSSRDFLRAIARRACLGVPLSHDLVLMQSGPWILVAYGVASTLYRYVVMVLILFSLHRVLDPHGFAVAAKLLAIVTLTALVVTCASDVVQFFQSPSRRYRMSRLRLTVVCLLVAACLTAASIIPLPCWVRGAVIVEPETAAHIYVTVPGTLAWCVSPGAVVAQDEPLARIENVKLSREITQLEGERDRKQIRLKNLESIRTVDPSVASSIPVIREELHDIECQLAECSVDARQLELPAPQGGVVMSAPHVFPDRSIRAVSTWSGDVLAQRNRNCFVETGTLICLVGDPSSQVATLFVNQRDIEFVAVGQTVEINLDHQGVHRGVVEGIAEADTAEVPRQLQDALSTKRNANGTLSSVETLYQVRVALDDTEAFRMLGASGHARISIEGRSLGLQLLRYLRQTFTFRS